MAVKSVTVTEEAYRALKNMKLEAESFSQTILRVAKSRRGIPEKFFGIWKGTENAAAVKRSRKKFDEESEKRAAKIKEKLG